MLIGGKQVDCPINPALISSDLGRPISSRSNVNAQYICDLLLSEGIKTYVMGGAVRDWILGISARDIDIMAEASLGRILDVIAPVTKELSLQAKPHYGLMYVKGDLGDVDLNSMRDCDDIGDASDIDDVFFRPAPSFDKDPPHRDFSVNAFYYSVGDAMVINHHPEALDDLRSKTLRIVTDQRKIKIDYRVTIRILQFMARGYSPTPETLTLLRERLASDVMKTYKYRVWMDVHVPPASADRSRFESLALEYVDDSSAQRTLEGWFRESSGHLG